MYRSTMQLQEGRVPSNLCGQLLSRMHDQSFILITQSGMQSCVFNVSVTTGQWNVGAWPALKPSVTQGRSPTPHLDSVVLSAYLLAGRAHTRVNITEMGLHGHHCHVQSVCVRTDNTSAIQYSALLLSVQKRKHWRLYLARAARRVTASTPHAKRAQGSTKLENSGIVTRNEKKVTRPGDCCPECVPTHGACDSLDPPRYSGDLWNTSSCEYCMCDKGKVLCHKASCENLVCFKEEVLIHHPGSCCPQCVIPPSCELAGQTHKDGSWWKADDCTLCECHDGVTRCYQEHCPDCPSGHRRNSLLGECCGTCEKITCNPQCTDCEIGAPDNCTSCTNTQLFVQDGRCLHTCRMGFYPSPHGTCLPCDETCYTCIEGSQFHCEMCQPGLMWKHGECVTQCGLGYYLQNGKCLECAPSCKSCSGPGSDQCVSCSNHAQHVTQHVRHAPLMDPHVPPAGRAAIFTKDSVSRGAHQECHPSCETCNGGSNKNCTSCFPGNKISKKGRCRSECDKGQYLAIDNICKDCESGCEECHAAWGGVGSVCSGCEQREDVPLGSICMEDCPQACGDHCLSCNSPTSCTRCTKNMLVSQGQCVTKCGQGQYEEGATMSCKGNLGPPILKVLNHIEVPDGEIATVDFGLFFVSDPDTPTEDLIVTIVTLPSNGDLVMATEGHDLEIKAGENMTVGEIMEGRLRFRHHAGHSDKGMCKLQVSDNKLTSPYSDLYFQGVMTSAITIATRSLLLATQGDITVIRSSVLDLHTLADPENVNITGTDGFHVITFLLNIQIREKESIHPVLMHNRVGHVTLGEKLQISNDLLLATVLDEAHTEEVVYTLTPTINNPQEGEVLMVVPIPPSGVGNGWDDIGEGYMAARLTRFLQRDIDEGRIWYKNRGTAAFTDFIRFEVADTGSSTDVLSDQAFKITVREKAVPGPMTHPTLASGIHLAIKVLENELVPITPASLSFMDHDTSPAGIYYEVTRPLGLRDGSLEHVERPSRNVHIFTQEDVNNNRIIYRPPAAELGYKEKEVFFFFTVSDGNEGEALIEHKFSITLVPVNNQPPRLTSLPPTLHLAQGGSLPIGQAVVSVVDDDTPLDNLTITLTRAPHSGKLEKMDGKNWLTLKEGDTFSYRELTDNVFQYRHDGSGTLYDTMQVVVSDGEHKTATSVDVRVLRMDQSAPHLLPSASCRLVVKEGTAQPITRDVLAFADSDDLDLNLNILLTKATRQGKLLLGNMQAKAGNTFTQADINNGKLSFLADSEIGQSHITEILIFNVSDISGNILPSQTLTVLIEPDNNLPPKVEVTKKLKVKEGGKASLTSDLITVTDLDTPLSDLVVVIATKPEHGAIRNIAPAEGSDVIQDRMVTKFPAEDLQNGYILYSQSDHVGCEPVSDSVVFYVEDGKNRSPPSRLNISIQGVNDEKPDIVVEQVFVQEGQRVVITNNSVFITDLDTAPSNITLTEILDGLLMYGHDGSQVAVDTFSLLVTDGNHTSHTRVPVIMGLINDESPRVVVNRGLRVYAGTNSKITWEELHCTDMDSDAMQLTYTVTKEPRFGALYLGSASHAQMVSSKGPVSSFTQEGVFEGDAIVEFHQSDLVSKSVKYVHTSLSEDQLDSFIFSVSDGANSVTQPFTVRISPVDDSIPFVTNNGLKVQAGVRKVFTEFDLKAEDLDTTEDLLTFKISQHPQHGNIERLVDSDWQVASSFSMSEIYEGHVSYMHDGRKAMEDVVRLTATDGTNEQFIVSNNGEFSLPQTESFANLGLQFLEDQGPLTGNIITSHELRAVDEDTPATRLEFVVRKAPDLGRLELTTHPGVDVASFTQGNIFHITWSVVEFEQPLMNVTETAGVVLVPIVRKGYLKQYSMVTCHTQYGTATSSEQGRRETFYVELIQPSFTLLGSSMKISVTIEDLEDEPVLQFQNAEYHVKEGDSYLSANILRTGDISSTVSTICYTTSLSARGSPLDRLDSGSDYISRGNKASEQFDLQLTLPSYGARLGARAHATVVIDGPNDESSIHFSQASYNFSEDAGTVSVELVRDGNDLSHTSTTCQLTLLDDTLDPRVEGVETFSVFLSSAVSSNLVQPYHATVSIDDTWQDVPSMSFEESSYMVDESSGHVSVQIVRTGDSSLESSVVCYTQQDFALVGVDYVDRALSEEARIVKNCTVEIVNDDIFESNETFHMQLAQPLGSDQYQAYVGEMNSTTVTITNTDDVPKIQFERSAYSIPEPSVKDQITTVMLRVMRFGDVTRTASVRCSTRDGSAAAGTDFNPKSQFLVFAEGVKNLNFTVDVLYNSDIEWHETFSIVLGPDQPAGAELGLVSTATITILDNDVSGSMVLPAPPVVVSLLQYDSVETGMRVEPTPGYPLVCVTPCDPHYPTYTTTQPLCEQGGMNQSAMFYRWEVAVPDLTGARPPFIEISYNTVFTSVNHITLDSIYFRPSFQVRCVVQPLDTKGNPGIPLKSNPVLIGRDNGICKSSRYSGLPFSYEAQSFHATLDYVGTEDKSHPNTIHVKVKVPHQDGMLPLISTFPISNLKYVLSEPIYRQQHLCSNIIIPEERSILLQSGFLGNSSIQPKHLAAGYDFPYQFDPELRDAKTLMFYKYLNMKECLWQFEAWYHMTDLVDLCGGRAMSDFQVRGRGQTYLTVRVPLYVSYLYAVAPIGWGSLEHMTELEFSFYYDTVLWRSGLETRGQLGGRLQVMRVVIGDDRRLVVDIKTQAKFRGVYVLSHPTLPGYTSRFVSKETDIKFDLDLVWGQNTFDGPQQLWRATSQFSFKDYSGKYSVELIPCTVSGTQSYTIHSPMPCTAQQPLEFEVPIAFQQSNRPVPLEYTLNTHFQITNKEQEFFANPFSRQNVAQSGDNDVAFAKGDQLYGRVLWSPEQDLQAAFSLALERVYICAGRDGHIPTYDPTGTVYNSGPQYGCIRPGPDLKYRFLVLDRSAPKFTSKQFEGVRFDAMFASESPQYASLVSVPGMDGFVLRVDPLYKVMSGFQWYLQVIYSIGPTDSIFRRKRSALLSLDKNKRSAADSANMKYDWLESNTSKNGTNIKVLNLNNTQVQEVIAKTDSEGGINLLTILLPIICAVIILLIISCVIIIIIRKKRRKRHQRHVPVHRRNNLEPCPRNTVIYKGKPNNPITVRCSSSLELKQSVVYKGDHGKSAVRIKDTNIQKDKNISKNNGTEV
ncbi:FRAS1-like protein [Mya arenaria]|uniref:FRAS1-like protein n=1 Tax=Mya arenaria TaxID=6604 RepID=A0ABY7DEB5_MYAAR|nr:FRAS1-like protein [Mya arenaria]